MLDGRSYPESPRGDVVDVLHGEAIPDPYRWLEDLDGEATAEWVRHQNACTEDWLAAVPERAAIRARLEAWMDYERSDVPRVEGGRLFFLHNDGLLSQDVLVVQDGDEGTPRVLLDPNTLSEDGTVSLGPCVPSPDGRLLAYALQDAGSDWLTWHARDVDTGVDLPDRIRWSRFSTASWARDGTGFYYSSYAEPVAGPEAEGALSDQRLRFHRLGTAAVDDPVVLEDPDHPQRGFAGRVTHDGRTLVIHVWEGTSRRNRLYLRELEGDGALIRLLDDHDAAYEFVGLVESTCYVKTDRDADRSRIVAIDLDRPAPAHWREVVPEAEGTLRQATLVGGRLVCVYLQDAYSRVRCFDLDGDTREEVALPGIGSVAGFAGSPDDTITYYGFTSFTRPLEVHRYDLVTGTDTCVRRPRLAGNPDEFETRQVFVSSPDGTQVPIFLVHRKGLTLDGQRPTYLTGYGGFDIPLTPAFSVSAMVWMEMGGVWAVANLRGGGEYGRAWHEAGTLAKKQNVFDDFIACAEWLVDEGITSREQLAIGGGSNGGLLVGACMTQRPDLFGVCLPQVGVMDMLRFHRFTIGWAWISDYGSPEDPELFPHLLAYSPLHNLKAGTCYPATLITTGDHDDRVVPSHSFKFAAELQRVQACEQPCLLRVETRAGHGAGKPTDKLLDEVADRWAFCVRALAFDGALPDLTV